MDHKLTHQFYLIGKYLYVTPPLTDKEENPLELSIQKWETIVALLEAGKFVSSDSGWSTCALCKHYIAACDDCPIYLTTGYRACVTTPYDDFEFVYTIEEKLEIAKAEVEFLKSLKTEET